MDYKITEIDQAFASLVIEQRDNDDFLGLFYFQDGDRIVGIDNTSNDAWVEDFPTYEKCELWLLGFQCGCNHNDCDCILCSVCDGHGYIKKRYAENCPNCEGSGFVKPYDLIFIEAEKPKMDYQQLLLDIEEIALTQSDLPLELYERIVEVIKEVQQCKENK